MDDVEQILIDHLAEATQAAVLPGTLLAEGNLLESMAFVSFVAFVESRFGLEFSEAELQDPGVFHSVRSLASHLAARAGGAKAH